MLEKEIEAAVCKYAKEKGLLAYKFSSPSHVGVPDRLFIGQDVIFFIEFKSEKGKLTPSQSREFDRMTDKGAVVFVVKSVEDGKKVIDASVRHMERIAAVSEIGDLLKTAFEMQNAEGEVKH